MNTKKVLLILVALALLAVVVVLIARGGASTTSPLDASDAMDTSLEEAEEEIQPSPDPKAPSTSGPTEAPVIPVTSGTYKYTIGNDKEGVALLDVIKRVTNPNMRWQVEMHGADVRDGATVITTAASKWATEHANGRNDVPIFAISHTYKAKNQTWYYRSPIASLGRDGTAFRAKVGHVISGKTLPEATTPGMATAVSSRFVKEWERPSTIKMDVTYHPHAEAIGLVFPDWPDYWVTSFQNTNPMSTLTYANTIRVGPSVKSLTLILDPPDFMSKAVN
jgi:hypothetical protein